MQLFIYGAGNLGKELYDFALLVNQIQHKWDDVAFLDEVKKENQFYGARIYRMYEIEAMNKQEFEVVIANGEPINRKSMYKKLKEKNIKMSTLIHPTAIVSPTAILKEGVIIGASAFISSDVVIHENVLIQPSVVIGHDAEVYPHSVLSPISALGGETTVKECVYVALGAVIKQKVVISHDTIVAMGAVVNKNLKCESIYAGNPARRISDNFMHKVFVEYINETEP